MSNHSSFVFRVIGGKIKFNIIYGHGYEPMEIYTRATKVEEE